MGLVYDSNKTFKIPTAKELLQPMEVAGENSNCDEEMSAPSKNYVAKELEDDAKAPRAKNFRLPNNQVTWLTYLMDKYDEDYKVCYNYVTNCKCELLNGIMYISQHSLFLTSPIRGQLHVTVHNGRHQILSKLPILHMGFS
jgi:hypothetical protein